MSDACICPHSTESSSHGVTSTLFSSAVQKRKRTRLKFPNSMRAEQDILEERCWAVLHQRASLLHHQKSNAISEHTGCVGSKSAILLSTHQQWNAACVCRSLWLCGDGSFTFLRDTRYARLRSLVPHREDRIHGVWAGRLSTWPLIVRGHKGLTNHPTDHYP